MESTLASHVEKADLEIREGVVWDETVEGLIIPTPLAAMRGQSPSFPTLLLSSLHTLSISEDRQTDQIDGFGERTGLAEIDPYLLRSQMLTESTASAPF